MTYDPKVYDLAKGFLDDNSPYRERDIKELAEAIQSTIEDFIESFIEQRAERDHDLYEAAMEMQWEARRERKWLEEK